MKRTAITTITMLATALSVPLGLGSPLASASSAIECGSANGYTVTVEDSAESCPFAIKVADAFPAAFNGDATTISVVDPKGQQHQITCGRKYQLVIECRDTAAETLLVYLISPHPGGDAG